MQRKYIGESGKIVVRIKGPITLACGEEISIDSENIKTVKDLWIELDNRYKDKALEEGVYPALKDLPSQNLVLVNDIEISALNNLETPLKPGDIVTIINYTHGG
jgi:molybdopterin converting factor small subunit